MGVVRIAAEGEINHEWSVEEHLRIDSQFIIDHKQTNK